MNLNKKIECIHVIMIKYHKYFDANARKLFPNYVDEEIQPKMLELISKSCANIANVSRLLFVNFLFFFSEYARMQRWL